MKKTKKIYLAFILAVLFLFSNNALAAICGSDGSSCDIGGISGTCSGGICMTNLEENSYSGDYSSGGGSYSGGWNPGSLEESGLPAGSVYVIAHSIMYWILGIFGILAVIGFAISGIIYIVSSGNEDTMKKAKQAMIYSIIGVIVALSGLVVIFAVDGALRGSYYF